MALSNDSTCVNQLDSHLSGNEVFRLNKKRVQRANSHNKKKLVLPTWTQGKWDSIEGRGSDMMYRSKEMLTTYHMRAILSPAPGIFLTKVEKECGE